MKVIGYIRVSTEEQASGGVSLAHQEAKIKAYAKLNDMELAQIIRDEGFSAKSIEGRPGAKRLLEITRSKAVNAVVVYKLDRLFRNAQEALETSLSISKNGIALHSVTEKLDTLSAMGRFFFTIMAACAEMERNLISERTRDALRYKKSRGEVYNHASFGSDIKDGALLLNQREQTIISIMSDMRDEGASLSTITKYLNHNAIPAKKGGKWHPQTVKSVLANILRRTR